MENIEIERKLMKVVRKPPVDIEFNNLSYKIGKKEILHSINGKFLSGQLIGILGASGSGKTTLLNILTGQLLSGVSGEILVNDDHRNMRKFRKISAYLMQEDLLQPLLTVQESAAIVANLKLGRQLNRQEKFSVILDVLTVIGLEECLNVKVENLSGGQRKRLSIALELVNNPPLIFLDEPTTGLDNVAMKNCVELLKSLSNQGRTVICTIHQPSDSVFKLFDQVYFLSDGYCIYNGTVSDMVPFLSKTGFDCPKTYSPADYIIEVANSHSSRTKILSDGITNGKITNLKRQSESKRLEFEYDEEYKEFPISFWEQCWILLYRRFLQLKRNKTMIFLDMLHHLMSGVFLGILFFNVGNSGVHSYDNIKLYFGTVVYLMYTHLLGPILLFPEEVKLLQREYFNRWYSLKAFFAALTISVLPIMFLTSISYILLVYPLTGQPMEFSRFSWFVFVNLLMSLAADGFGYCIGSILNPMHGATVGSAVSVPLVLMSIYDIGHGDVTSPISLFFRAFSFPYQAWVSLTIAMLRDRDLFECEEIYCYFGDPKFLLKKMGMEDQSQYTSALILFASFVIFKIISYVALRFRVSQYYTLTRMKLKPLFKLFNLD